jgi:hypothetical protein
MKLKDTEKALMYGISEGIIDFKIRLSDLTFKRKDKFGFDMIQLIIHDKIDGIVVTPHIYIRHNKVEELVTKFSESDNKEMITIGNDLSCIIYNCNEPISKISFLINDEFDIKNTVNKIVKLINTIGEDFFLKFRTIESVDYAINLNPESQTALLNVNPSRCIRGLIIAKLVNNPNLNNLTKIYSTRMELVNERDKKTFKAVIEWTHNCK